MNRIERTNNKHFAIALAVVLILLQVISTRADELVERIAAYGSMSTPGVGAEVPKGVLRSLGSDMATASPGITIGRSLWDMQQIASMGRMVDWRTDMCLHFTYTFQPLFSGQSQIREVWSCAPAWDIVSAVPCDLTSSPDIGMYANLDVDDTSRFVVGGNVGAGGVPPFVSNISYQDPELTCSSTSDDLGSTPLWPRVEQRLIGGINYTYILGFQGTPGTVGDITFYRKVGFGSGGFWNSPIILGQSDLPSHDITASRSSGKIASAWLKRTGQSIAEGGNQFDKDLVYRVSFDNGLTWQAEVNVTKYQPDVDGYRAYADLSSLYDSNDQLHLTWTGLAWENDYYSNPPTTQTRACRLFHYSDEFNLIRTIKYAEWEPPNCAGGEYSLNIAHSTISECNGKLYAIWTQFNDVPNGIDDDCSVDLVDVSHTANGEIFMSVSSDLTGSSWDRARNLTNTYTPACDTIGVDSCASENWATMSRYGMDQTLLAPGHTWPSSAIVDPTGSYSGDFFLHMMYVSDLWPGASANGEGGQTDNALKWAILPCVDAVLSTQITFLLPPDTLLQTLHGAEAFVPIFIENLGNTPSNYTVTWTEFDGPSGWLDVSGFDGVISSGSDNQDTGTVTFNPGGIVNAPGSTLFVNGQLVVQQLGGDSIFINIGGVISDLIGPCVAGKTPLIPTPLNPEDGEKGANREPLLRWIRTGDTLLSANFDNKLSGNTPIGTGGAEANEPFAVSGNISARVRGGMGNSRKLIIQNSSGSSGDVEFRFLGQQEYNSGFVTFEADLAIAFVSEYGIDFAGPSNERFLFLRFANNFSREIWYDDNDNTAIQLPMNYDKRETFHLTVRFDLDNGTYDVWFDNTQVLSDESNGLSGSGLKDIRFISGLQPGNPAYYSLDNLVVTWEECETKYDVYLDTSFPPTQLLVSNSKVPIASPSLPLNGTTYWWQVVAKNGVFEAIGPAASFTVEASDVDGAEVADEYIQYYEGMECNGLNSDVPGLKESARDFSRGLRDRLGWEWKYSRGNGFAFANDFGIGDNDWGIDQVDFAYYGGHGGAFGFTFSKGIFSDNGCDISPWECVGRWGDLDLEWIAFQGCKIVSSTSRTAWHDCFDGLHLICGFESNAWSANYGENFAKRLADNGKYTIPGAWYWEIRRSHPSGGWRVGFLAEEPHFMNEYVYGSGRVFVDPVHNDGLFYASYNESGTPTPLLVNSHSSDVIVYDHKIAKAPTVVLPNADAVLNIAGDSIPSATVVAGGPYDTSYVRTIADGLCSEYGILCGNEIEIDSVDQFMFMEDDVNNLRVYPATGGWEYFNQGLFMVPICSFPILTEAEAMSRLNGLLTNNSWLPTDVGGETTAVFTMGMYDSNTGDAIPDSVWDNHVSAVISRNIGGFPVIGAGAEIEGIFGDTGEVHLLAYGGWRDVTLGSMQSTISLSDALASLASSGGDIAMGNIPQCDTFIVVQADLGFYEPYSDTIISKLTEVWILQGLCVFSGDTSDYTVLIPALFEPPSGEIINPVSGEVYSSTSIIFLEGAATRGTPPYQFNWYSDLDGVLGAGQMISVSGLSSYVDSNDILAEHTIILEIIDSNGFVDYSGVNITVTSFPAGQSLLTGFEGKTVDSPIGTRGASFGEPSSVNPNLSAIIRTSPMPSQSLEIDNSSNPFAWPIEFEFINNAIVSSGILLLQADLWFPVTGQYSMSVVGTGLLGDVDFVKLELWSDGTVKAGGQSIGTYSPGIVLPVSVRVDIDNGLYDVGGPSFGVSGESNGIVVDGFIVEGVNRLVFTVDNVSEPGTYSGKMFMDNLSASSSCCNGITGNVDGDGAELIDISDLTALIGYLFIPPNAPPQCFEEGNIDGDLGGIIDIADLTALIGFLFIPPNNPPAACQ